MKIEVWSDFVCPFCYMGKRILEQAISQFGHQDDIEIIFKSYELYPNEISNPNQGVIEGLADKYNVSLAEANKMMDNVASRAKEYGLQYNVSSMKQTNTMDAHRLAKHAEYKGLGKEMTERLLKAYFIDGIFIGSKESLVNLSKEVGLDTKEVINVLESDTYKQQVQNDELEAKQIGVQGVPFFVFNRKYAISGAQSIEVFIDTLEKVWQEEQGSKIQFVESNNDAVCNDDGCVIPDNSNS